MEPTIHNIEVKSVLTKSNLPVADYSVNPYTGCEHGCKYCYASFMKRFTNHPEPWGTFVDIKHWPEIKHPEKYAGKELFIGSSRWKKPPVGHALCWNRCRAAAVLSASLPNPIWCCVTSTSSRHFQMRVCPGQSIHWMKISGRIWTMP